ncbi:MazG-related protein [Vibrio profundi]|uniref:MazG-related protein n=1 Tax=Vibrio profundi TaxID=1774960 RepID=UPI00373693C8
MGSQKNDKVFLALEWIQQILESHQVPYQIVGGLAVRMHGGSREVADIDLYIPKTEVNKIWSEVSGFISKPLKHYVEEGWDLEYFQLIYQSQKIEIGLSPGSKIYSSATEEWVELSIDYSCSVHRQYANLTLPTMPTNALIEYKRVLGREVDLIDISDLTRA